MFHSSVRIDRYRGFTLIEVLVVIAILGLLAALVGTNVIDNFERAKIDMAVSDAVQINSAAKSYYVRVHRPPTLEDLIDPPPELDGFDDVPLDPWNREYELRTDGAPHTWEVISYGPDRTFGTEDDISSRDAKRQRRTD